MSGEKRDNECNFGYCRETKSVGSNYCRKHKFVEVAEAERKAERKLEDELRERDLRPEPDGKLPPRKRAAPEKVPCAVCKTPIDPRAMAGHLKKHKRLGETAADFTGESSETPGHHTPVEVNTPASCTNAVIKPMKYRVTVRECFFEFDNSLEARELAVELLRVGITSLELSPIP